MTSVIEGKGWATREFITYTPLSTDTTKPAPVDSGEFFEIEVRVGDQLVEPFDSSTKKKTPAYLYLKKLVGS
ncbi:hypothetical protein [Phormidesmis priestleyi]